MTPAPPSWWIYHGDRDRPDPQAIDRLPAPPPWRTFRGEPVAFSPGEAERADTFRPVFEELRLVNAAILLRRPLLVTGRPGCGKSSLARSIAWELGLGPLLMWPINTRSTLTEGLYRYDAIARLQDASLRERDGDKAQAPHEISKYLRLGPLGEAMVPATRPRVVLVDEIDKSDVDLPNDLLHVFEEGRFEIPELTRLLGTEARLAARTGDGTTEVPLPDGTVRCRAFPIVVMTSNGERDFPPAFLRRCVRLQMRDPDEKRLRQIVEAHLRGVDTRAIDRLMADFLRRRKDRGLLATDQLLNAVYLATQGGAADESPEALAAMVFHSLSEEG